MIRNIPSIPSGWVALLLVLLGTGYATQHHRAYHTTPDKWEKPRIFHTPFDADYEERLTLSHQDLVDASLTKVRSPNGGYWAGIASDNLLETPTAKPDKFPSHVKSPDFAIYVFNERSAFLAIDIKGHDPRYVVRIRWINEKLLYIRVWWGRVLGTDMILDVETESMIFKEMIDEGGIAFQQGKLWKQSKESNTDIESKK
jgi:hypothetical protein